MSTVISLQSIVEALYEAETAYKKKILDLVDDTMLPPTWDGKRYHAPCDSYVFDGVSYAGGQYLHCPDGGSVPIKYRVTVAASSKEMIEEELLKFDIGVEFGKCWEVEGEMRCYAYITGLSRSVSRIQKLVPGSGKFLVEAAEGVKTGTTWETTLGKLKSKIGFDGRPMIDIEEKLLRKIYNYILAEGKKKPVKVTVGYCYSDYIVV